MAQEDIQKIKDRLQIEIPFGAKDSELKGWEYTIPENMEAEIKDGKIIVKQKESEDEKIRKQLIGFLSGRYALCNINTKDAIAYLERQKEQKPLPPANSGARYCFDEWIKQQPTPKYWDAFLAGIDFNKKEQGPMHFLEIPAGDIAPAEEDGPFDEDEFLDGELSAFLQNYDKEYDDDAAVSDVARHFYEIGKKQKEQKPASGNSEKPNNHAEWSEEDGNKLYQVMEVLLADKTIALRENPHCKALHRAYDELLDWLKSLRPQPHWKPSEEQMNAIDAAQRELCSTEYNEGLCSLIDDLQKLL